MRIGASLIAIFLVAIVLMRGLEQALDFMPRSTPGSPVFQLRMHAWRPLHIMLIALRAGLLAGFALLLVRWRGRLPERRGAAVRCLAMVAVSIAVSLGIAYDLSGLLRTWWTPFIRFSPTVWLAAVVMAAAALMIVLRPLARQGGRADLARQTEVMALLAIIVFGGLRVLFEFSATQLAPGWLLRAPLQRIAPVIDAALTLAIAIVFWRYRGVLLRAAAGHCPSCGYCLQGRYAAGCPECGWQRG